MRRAGRSRRTTTARCKVHRSNRLHAVCTGGFTGARRREALPAGSASCPGHLWACERLLASAAPASGRGAVQVTFFSTEKKSHSYSAGVARSPDRAPGRASRRARPGPIASSRPGLRPGRWGPPGFRIGRPVALAGGARPGQELFRSTYQHPPGPSSKSPLEGPEAQAPGGGLGLRPFKRILKAYIS